MLMNNADKDMVIAPLEDQILAILVQSCKKRKKLSKIHKVIWKYKGYNNPLLWQIKVSGGNSEPYKATGPEQTTLDSENTPITFGSEGRKVMSDGSIGY
jgi:hypothetical protein